MLWLGATAHGVGSVVLPLGAPDSGRLRQAAAGLPGVTLVDKARSVSVLLGHYRRIAAWALGAAILLVWLLLALWRGFRASSAMVAPPCLGMLFALAGGALAGAPVTLFTVMALILLLGFGVDYTVFLEEGGETDPSALLGVLLAAGATLISYGLLAFSHTPALGGFGLTLALGVVSTTQLSFLALRPGERS
jgi:predicted exporter